MVATILGLVKHVASRGKHEGTDRPCDRINKAACYDVFRCEHFQALMWKYVPSDTCRSEIYTNEFTSYVQWAALKAFGTSKDTPRKPWISASTWGVVRSLVPLRRTASAAMSAAVSAKQLATFYAWASCIHRDYVPGVACSSNLGWYAVTKRDDALVYSKQMRLVSSVARYTSAKVQSYIAVKAKRKWLEHLTDVLAGTQMSSQQLCDIPVAKPIACDFAKPNPASTASAINCLRNNCGTGRDGVAAEVLKAGGDALACKLSGVYQCVVDTEDLLTCWSGSKVAKVHKKKGSKAVCDEYRGIHLDNHMAKGSKELLNDEIKPPYEENMPSSQYGAVVGRGTDLAAHVVISFIEYCACAKLCLLILYVDLTKAYDKSICELVLGIPHDVKCPAQYFASLSLEASQSEWFIEFISVHCPLFPQWAVSEKVLVLIKTLHAMGLMSYGDVDEAISIRVGGKQGCKYGSTIFNGPYSVGL